MNHSLQVEISEINIAIREWFGISTKIKMWDVITQTVLASKVVKFNRLWS